MTDVEQPEQRPRAGLYFHEEFQHARRPDRPYAPPQTAIRLPPPPRVDDDSLEVPTPILWQILIPVGILLSVLLGLALALGLALLVLTLGTELLRKLGLL
jgi:hypothetical protein